MPDFVLEIVSPSTWRRDLGAKRARYAALGVGEYWLHDPHGRYLQPALAGYRLVGGTYVALQSRIGTRGPSIRSDVLGLDLLLDGERLRFFDPADQRFLPTYDEAESGRAEAEARNERAQARIAELERLLDERSD